MSNPPVLFVHGFCSSGAGGKPKQLQQMLYGQAILSPSLSHRPSTDIAMLESLVDAHAVQTVVGSSLGGFYALVLAARFKIKLVLINPSMVPWETLADDMGLQTVFGTIETFQWTEVCLEELRSMGASMEEAIGSSDPSFWAHVLVLLSRHDERLGAAETARRLPKASIVWDEEQGHRFEKIGLYSAAIRSNVLG